MKKYKKIKEEFDKLLSKIINIISKAAQGENVDLINLSENCTGFCGTCEGCN